MRNKSKIVEYRRFPKSSFPDSFSSGQAMVEYVIVFFFCMAVFMAMVQVFLGAFDQYVQGIYFLLMQAYP